MIEIDTEFLGKELFQTALRAGRAQMEIYGADFDVATKTDDSPVTAADLAAEKIILQDLKTIAPQIPVLAEESFAGGQAVQTADQFFLVDPLDGTKEFISKNGEFTVNIALVENGAPVFGLIYVPAKSEVYLTPRPDLAVSVVGDFDRQPRYPDDLDVTPITTRNPPRDGLVAAASRSHMNQTTLDYLESIDVRETVRAGSSLKFCVLACGLADVYPRFGTTMEWDTAAGHAILRAAGGDVLTEQGAPLRYGKTAENYKNPSFIAWGKAP